MNTTDCGGYQTGNILTVHYTHSEVGTNVRRVRALCGQKSRISYYHVHAVPQEVNCKKCLAAA